jgi:23S rRNA (adenine-N6)-dimethyltransferase
MSSSQLPGPHELGQNAITDRRVLRAVVDLAATTDGPIVEWAAGGGALTLPLAGLGRPVEAVEVDPRKVARLRRAVGPHVCITEGDILRHAPPATAYTLVCNVPFHITTRVLRRLLPMRQWETAILITQWEVARKRAGVGGATQLTAQWWPWYEFILQQRIPSTAFSPRPSVDAGLLVIRRRHPPLLEGDHEDYHRWVRRVFTGRGHGMPQILTRSGGVPARDARTWCADQHLTPRTLPKDLDAEQWASAYRLAIRRH